MNMVITIRPLLIPMGSAWDNYPVSIPIGSIFIVDQVLDDRLVVHNQDHRIALFEGDYKEHD